MFCCCFYLLCIFVGEGVVVSFALAIVVVCTFLYCLCVFVCFAMVFVKI